LAARVVIETREVVALLMSSFFGSRPGKGSLSVLVSQLYFTIAIGGTLEK
jgi:hypothetical protein